MIKIFNVELKNKEFYFVKRIVKFLLKIGCWYLVLICVGLCYLFDFISFGVSF